jgi:hypothetical protein
VKQASGDPLAAGPERWVGPPENRTGWSDNALNPEPPVTVAKQLPTPNPH